ncbi:hypothetical protein HNR46_002368 [Haloferula luteola]|uniref:DUF2891 domain-containing protein n=1 Tax=Haloferula luteola TaxID=595692 RepID=A0A840V1A3_9BACT|nr:DUF2891 domain-containing protein [Haloferula luteola]MBB5352127.1 hypothetical protein [Haloferula luteola]
MIRQIALAAVVAGTTLAQETPMTLEQANGFVELARSGIDREFPNKTSHVTTGPEDLRTPRQMHPVFYGHFDWHSSVHGHWTLVRLLKLFPDADFAPTVRDLLDHRFTADALAAEAAYFEEKDNRSFERMYGWAWALRLAAELRTWDDPLAQSWAQRYAPLEKVIVRNAKDYLPKLDWPVRCGFHPESSFPLAQMWDYAQLTEDSELAELVRTRALQFYGKDRDYPVAYEPSGNDFFSPGLNVADLMRRVLPPETFSSWLQDYFPHLAEGQAGNLLTPVTVSDPSDGHLIHLAGLNLSRAWTMRGIVSALDDTDPRRNVLEAAAKAHTEAGLRWIGSGHYEGDHWLGSFAVYLLTGVGKAEP